MTSKQPTDVPALFDPEDGPRFWIDDDPKGNPFKAGFGYGIVDERAGGIVAYVGTRKLADAILRALAVA